jgi:hypothetical protein
VISDVERATVLRMAADDLRQNAGRAWGGERSWLTTGTHVAEVAAEWLEQTAAELSPQEVPRDRR